MHAEDAIVSQGPAERKAWRGALSQSWTGTDLVYLISRRVLLVYALLVGGGALLYLGWEIAETRRAVTLRHAELHQSVDSVLSEALWTYNETVLDSVIRGLEQDPSITGARVQSEDGKADVEAGLLTDAPAGWGAWMTNRYVSRWPITWKSDRGVETIGVLELETSGEIIRDMIGGRLLSILGVSALALVSLLLAFVLVIRRHVVSPLSVLTRAMSELRLGQASPSVDTSQPIPDEIGRLYDAFRDLDVRLQVAHGKLTTAAEEMARQLAEQAASLEAAHRRNMGLEVIRAQELERRRLMRDMHDGFGSELVSARIAAERGSIDAAELATFLTKCIADLQLMISVTGTDSGHLGEAIADWRYRVSRQLSGERFRLVWEVNLAAMPVLPQRAVLQILRIAQESVFNAMRHSSASEIRIGVLWSDGAVMLSVSDDGRGFSPADLTSGSQRGKGLASMAARARELGAKLQFDTERGCRVALTYRPEPAADVQDPLR